MPPGDLRLSPISRWHAVCEIRDSVGNETTEKLKEIETKMMNRKSNRFSPQGKEHTMTQKSKATRTEIRDLPEIAVELAEEEMRITAGGALASGTSSYTTWFSSLGKTQYITYSRACVAGGDWDTDW